jgi:arabinose operon protein AraL
LMQNDVIHSLKVQRRKEAIARRDALSSSDRCVWSKQIWDRFFALPQVAEAQTLMLFSSIRSEVDTTQALQQVLASGKLLVLPVVNKATHGLEARIVTNLADLEPSSFGVPEPTQAAPIIDPTEIDVVAVPGLAFDRIGYRIGYGAGYYDRFLKQTRPGILTVGIAFAAQVEQRLPWETHDERVLCLITNEETLHLPRSGKPDRTYKGYIFDLDGTVYLGDKLIPKATETIAALRERAGVVFLSNKPINTRRDYAKKLTHLGIPTKPEEVINSSAVLAAYLKERMPGATLYCVAEPPMLEEMKQAGFRVLIEPEKEHYKVDMVVAAFDRTFDYFKLNNAYQCIKNGAGFIATNSDRTCPVENGDIPDCAAMIGAITGCSTVAPEVIVGKPHPLTANAALTTLNLKPNECLMVGDRVETDMRMGLLAGMETGLVLTGVSDRARMVRENVYPHFILDSIADLV